MKRLALAIVLVASLVAGLARAQDHDAQVSKVASTPQWEKIKSLVGEWEGYAMEGGQKLPTRISVRMTGDGSAVMHWMDAGSPHEMITMFHMDKDELLATHYCSAHNQPRMRALPPTQPAQIAFEFKDGTNIRPGDGYMRRLVITFVDADHHNEEWGYDSNGNVHAGTFYLTRVKHAAKP
jgi:YD repeat-containing protein